MNSDDIAVLDAKVMSNNTVHTCTPVIQLIISKDDQDCILAFLSFYQDSVTTKQLQSLHGVVGECNNRIIIVDGIRNPVATCVSTR
jgi:hypothetical protein